MNILFAVVITAAQVVNQAPAVVQKVAQAQKSHVAGVSSQVKPSGQVVNVRGVLVDKAISGPVDAMMAAAATQGIWLSGTGYRNIQVQINLRRQNCGPTDADIYQKPESQCTPPTALPGTSMHEKGLAIDFANCATRTTPTYKWLVAHAAQYGFYNRADEAWHWSTNGL